MKNPFDQPTLPTPDDVVTATPWGDGFTLAFHPDARRIGERFRIGKGVDTIELSRVTPLFCQPGGEAPRPLADPCVSRRPITLCRSAGAFVLNAPPDGVELLADGQPVTSAVELRADQVASGVVLEISGRVILLLHRMPAEQARLPNMGLVGTNPAVDELRRNIARVADLSVPVLIRGETGSGKELVAKALHRASDRSERPLVCVNMAAIPASTAASELFGHAKGAFTGAINDNPGYFTRAEGGTLFLDEIGATPLEVQTMLLRVLDAGEIQPVGAPAPRRVDVRLVAATDADLETASANESFSAALLHRLDSFQLFVPPLRARRDDIGLLLAHFVRMELEAIGETHRLSPPHDGDPTYVPPALVSRLLRFDWPGNVRQLRNVVRQLVIASRGEPQLRTGASVVRFIGESADSPTVIEADASASDVPVAGKPRSLTDAEVIDSLRSSDWQVNEAARRLGVSRSALYDRVKTMDRVRKARDLTSSDVQECGRACGGDLAQMARRLEVSRRALLRRMKELGLR